MLITTNTPSQVVTYTGTGSTVGATTADLITVAFPTSTRWLVEVSVLGKDGSGNTIGITKSIPVKRDSGNAAIVGTVASLVDIADTAIATADVALVISSNNLIARVTGVVLLTISWTASITIQRIL